MAGRQTSPTQQVPSSPPRTQIFDSFQRWRFFFANPALYTRLDDSHSVSASTPIRRHRIFPSFGGRDAHQRRFPMESQSRPKVIDFFLLPLGVPPIPFLQNGPGDAISSHELLLIRSQKGNIFRTSMVTLIDKSDRQTHSLGHQSDSPPTHSVLRITSSSD